jgi:SAM-dependent methyltransferase
VRPSPNLDRPTVEGFGVEWSRFDQSEVPAPELRRYFEQYFQLFPWGALPPSAVGFDLGCGSGRWARFVAERVGSLHCIDASDRALQVARRTLAGSSNCVFHHAGVDAIPLPDRSMDFGYSLGVLHHLPDTAAGIRSCVDKLKPGAPLLLYLYYAFDNRPFWFRLMWRASNVLRRVVSRLPSFARLLAADLVAGAVYLPLARLARAGENRGLRTEGWPLSYYRTSSFYTMRTDALDRLGTRLEHRFTAPQIEQMMTAAGLERIAFRRNGPPYWCAIGYRSE